jgi:hypothetical protein
MRRIDGQRREQREDLAQEMVVEPGALFLRHLRSVDNRDAVLRELAAQLAPALLLVARERRDRFRDARQLLGGREPVRAPGGDAGAQLAFQAGDAHHEELVKIVGRDREEAHPLQKRMADILGLLQHAAIEV